MSTEAIKLIAEYWKDGRSISETIDAVRSHIAETVTFSEVRDIFTQLSWAEAA